MPQKTEIRTIMSQFPFSVDYYDSVSKAENLMKREKIKHIPVVHDSKYVGMITEHTILEYNLKKIYTSEMGDTNDEEVFINNYTQIIVNDLPLIFPEDSINKAVELMMKKKNYALPVVDWHKNLVGIITVFDLLLFFHKKLNEDF